MTPNESISYNFPYLDEVKAKFSGLIFQIFKILTLDENIEYDSRMSSHSTSLNFFIYYFETESHYVVLAGLELII